MTVHFFHVVRIDGPELHSRGEVYVRSSLVGHFLYGKIEGTRIYDLAQEMFDQWYGKHRPHETACVCGKPPTRAMLMLYANTPAKLVEADVCLPCRSIVRLVEGDRQRC